MQEGYWITEWWDRGNSLFRTVLSLFKPQIGGTAIWTTIWTSVVSSPSSYTLCIYSQQICPGTVWPPQTRKPSVLSICATPVVCSCAKQCKRLVHISTADHVLEIYSCKYEVKRICCTRFKSFIWAYIFHNIQGFEDRAPCAYGA